MNILSINYKYTKSENYYLKKKDNNSTFLFQNQNLKNNDLPHYNPKIHNIQNITFKSCVINDDEILRSLLKYKIPDLYSERILLPRKKLEEILQQKIFSKCIGDVVKYMQPYEQCLADIEKEIYKLIKVYAKHSPKKNLEKIFINLYPKHAEKLIKQQNKIFNDILHLSFNLPQKELEQIKKLINLSITQINKKENVIPFNPTDFKYKLKRIEDGIKQRNIKKECKTIRTLLEVSQNLKEIKKVKKRGVSLKKENGEIKKQNAQILRNMNLILDKSPLKEDRELINLINTSMAQVYSIPTKTNFSRKVFLHELNIILKNTPDKNLKNKIIETASKIPNSLNSIDAFIVKLATQSSEKIGFSIFQPAMGTIEHLSPTKKGGANMLYNKGLASVKMNSLRGHEDFENLIKRNPKIIMFAKKQVEHLIKLANEGKFEEIGLARGYIVNYVNTLRKLSKGAIDIDISKLEKLEKQKFT